MDIISINLNISPKMSYGMLKCDIVRELHAYDFVIEKGALFVPDPVYYIYNVYICLLFCSCYQIEKILHHGWEGC